MFITKKHFLGISLNIIISVFLVTGIVFAAVTVSSNIKVGSGTNNLALDGDDVYITGTLEVDGISRFDGDVRFGGFATTTASNGNIATNGTLTVSGNVTFDTSTFFLDAAGNKVGIGDTSPDYLLDISSADTSSTTLSITNTNSNGDPILQFEVSDGVPAWRIGVDNDDSDKFRIATSSFSGTSGGITISSTSSYVGIGTTSPSDPLHVSSSATTTVNFDTTSTSRGSCIIMKDAGGTVRYATISGAGAWVIGTVSCK